MIKMVIVDDYIETIESLSLIYGLRGDIEIVGVASNSEELLGILSSKEVDFVSLDIQLGDEDGIEICKLIHRKYPDLFVVMCSVEATLVNRKLANAAGASHFLAKPISTHDVSETLQIFSNRNRNIDTHTSPLTGLELDKLFDAL